MRWYAEISRPEKRTLWSCFAGWGFLSAWFQDRIGRRRNVILFALCCAATVNLYVFLPIGDATMLILSFPLGLFAAGIPATLGARSNELYPQGIRGTGVGFCYNFGRVILRLVLCSSET